MPPNIRVQRYPGTQCGLASALCVKGETRGDSGHELDLRLTLWLCQVNMRGVSSSLAFARGSVRGLVWGKPCFAYTFHSRSRSPVHRMGSTSRMGSTFRVTYSGEFQAAEPPHTSRGGFGGAAAHPSARARCSVRVSDLSFVEAEQLVEEIGIDGGSHDQSARRQSSAVSFFQE